MPEQPPRGAQRLDRAGSSEARANGTMNAPAVNSSRDRQRAPSDPPGWSDRRQREPGSRDRAEQATEAVRMRRERELAKRGPMVISGQPRVACGRQHHRTVCCDETPTSVDQKWQSAAPGCDGDPGSLTSAVFRDKGAGSAMCIFPIARSCRSELGRKIKSRRVQIVC